MTKLRLTVAVALVALGGLGACSDGDTDRGAGGAGGDATTTTRTPDSTTTTTVRRTEPISFSVDGPPVDLGGGWTVTGCEGDAPVLCVRRDGADVGIVELATFPVESFQLDGFEEAVEEGDTEGAMRIVAADFLRTLEADRKDGCGADYEIEPIATEPATVLGQDGVRYGYVGRKAGRVVERQISAGTIDGDDVVLVNTPGYAADGCVPPEGEFTPDALESFEPHLRVVVANAIR